MSTLITKVFISKVHLDSQDSRFLPKSNDNSRHGADSYCRSSTAHFQLHRWEPDSSTADAPPCVLNDFASWQPEHSVWAQKLVFQVHCSSATDPCTGWLSTLSPLHIDCFDLPAPGHLCRFPDDSAIAEVLAWIMRQRGFVCWLFHKTTKLFLFSPGGASGVKQSARRSWRWYHAGRCQLRQQKKLCSLVLQILSKVQTELCYCG